MDGYPRVVIVVEGGLVQSVVSDIHLDVTLVDHDVEVAADEDSIIGEYALDAVGEDAVNDLLQDAQEENEKRHKERGANGEDGHQTKEGETPGLSSSTS